jgi:hypothetical protein
MNRIGELVGIRYPLIPAPVSGAGLAAVFMAEMTENRFSAPEERKGKQVALPA